VLHRLYALFFIEVGSRLTIGPVIRCPGSDLRRHRGWVRTSGLVFTREDGAGLHPEFVSRHFHRLIRRAGLRQVRFHDLRHCSASLQISAGVPLGIVSKRLGHSSIAITSDTYGHLLRGVGMDAAIRTAAMVPRAPRSAPILHPAAAEADTAPLPGDAKPQVTRGAPPGTRTPNPRIKSAREGLSDGDG